MAVKLAQYGRVVAYLPNLRTAVIRCRTFSSATNKFDVTDNEIDEEPLAPVNQIQWPEDVLGLICPKDKRFPLPGLVGACGNSRRIHQELLNARNQVPTQNQISLQDILPPLPGERHSDIAEQFLTSLDEIDPGVVTEADCQPSPMDKLECVAHRCPVILRKDFKELFPERDLMETELTVITLSLKTVHDMTMWSADVEEEREALLETFIQGAVELSQTFEEAGFWADFIDPASGKPTDERYRKLGFEINDLGCCKVISHPIWGTHAYIGSMFTSAPLNHPLITSLVKHQ